MAASHPTNFGENIRSLRLSLGISAQEMAEAVGLDVTSRNKIAQYETQGVEPTLGAAVRFADVLGVTLDELVSSELEPQTIECDKCKGIGRIVL